MLKSLHHRMTYHKYFIFGGMPVYDFVPVMQIQSFIRTKTSSQDIVLMFEDILYEQR